MRSGVGVLALIGAYDELWSGIAVVAAPGVEESHALGHDGYALWIFALPLLLGALLETPIALLADRLPLGRVIAASLGALALSLGLCATASSAVWLSIALALAGATSGVACAAAQVALVSADPKRAASALSRWTAGQAVGDSLAPLFVSAAIWLGGDHRNALAAIAALVALQALIALRAIPASGRPPAGAAPEAPGAGTGDGDGDGDEEPGLGLGVALRLAAGNARVWLYLGAASVCGLLDEVVVALAALRLHDDLGCSEALAAAGMTGISIGGLLGALATERLLARWTPRALLIATGVISLLALGAFIAASSTLAACAALCVLGAAAAPHHPLLMAAAYQQVPSRPGVVSALSNALVPLDVLLPLAIGLVASRFGLAWALAALALQPLIVLATALHRSGLRSGQKVL